MRVKNVKTSGLESCPNKYEFHRHKYLLRYLVKDDQDKAEACFRLLEKAKASKVELFTSESVIAEVVFVLSFKRLYNLSHQDIRWIIAGSRYWRTRGGCYDLPAQAAYHTEFA